VLLEGLPPTLIRRPPEARRACSCAGEFVPEPSFAPPPGPASKTDVFDRSDARRKEPCPSSANPRASSKLDQATQTRVQEERAWCGVVWCGCVWGGMPAVISRRPCSCPAHGGHGFGSRLKSRYRIRTRGSGGRRCGGNSIQSRQQRRGVRGRACNVKMEDGAHGSTILFLCFVPSNSVQAHDRQHTHIDPETA